MTPEEEAPAEMLLAILKTTMEGLAEHHPEWRDCTLCERVLRMALDGAFGAGEGHEAFGRFHAACASENRCANCREKVVPLTLLAPWPAGGLVLTLSGVAGMAVNAAAVSAMLCRKCTTALREALPGVASKVEWSA